MDTNQLIYENIRKFVETRIRMNTKLTLSIDKDVISAAKEYAHTSGRSLSELIEAFLKSIVAHPPRGEQVISTNIRSLMGSFPVKGAFDYKESLRIALEEKHNRHED
jgi:hypothetical protein